MSGDYKKLVRPRDDRMIAGVCAGFARYLNVDPVLVRLLMVVLVLFAGTGIVVYLAGWILMPEEDQAPSSDTPYGY